MTFEKPSERLREFQLMGAIKGALVLDADGGYSLASLELFLKAAHALDGDATGLHLLEDTEPDDALIHDLLAEWRRELNGARPNSRSGGRGRRTNAEMEWLRYNLYRAVEEEYPISVRGAYYRAEARGLVPKTNSGYKLVQSQILKMRRDRLLPWRWITDHSRRVWGHRRFGDMESYADYVARNYRADYWIDSPVNVEVWCEKDAMQGVIAPVVLGEFGLSLYVSKGQASASYLYEAATEIKDDGRPTVVYVLSDFDPAGFRIAENIERGLREHLGDDYPLEARRVAVTHEQVLAYELPTRAVKRSDSGAPEFLSRYGDISAELEAMPPSLLRGLIREGLEVHMDQERLRALKMVEEQEREGLKGLSDLIGGAA